MGGWITLGILAFLALLLWAPIHVWAAYDGETRLKVRYLFFSLKLLGYPKREKPSKPPKPKKEKAPKAEKEGKPKEKKKFELGTLLEMIRFVLELVKAAVPPILWLFGRIRVHRLKLEVCAATGDAAETAILYGRLNAYLHGALAALRNIFRFDRVDLLVDASYDINRTTDGIGEVDLSLRPAHILWTGLWMLGRMVKVLFTSGLPGGKKTDEHRPPKKSGHPAPKTTSKG